MARTTTKKTGGYIFLPFRSDQVWKITVTDNSGVELDITNLITSCEVEDYCTESIGKFKFEIYDPSAIYAALWTGNEIFKYYKDYGTTATTLRFRGRVEKVSKKYHNVVVDGRSESLIFLTKKVTASYTDQETSTILTSLISNYASGFTANNVTAGSVDLTVNWVDKPFWECVKELCAAAASDCYVDANLDFHYFVNGSRQNNTEAVSHTNNLLEIDDFTPDISAIRNRIKVYGATIDGVRLFYTADDETSQSLYGIKEELIEDDNITTYSQIVEVANFELSNLKNPPIIGSVKSFLLVGVRPGDSLRIDDEDDGLKDGFYNSSGYVDKISYTDGEYSTEVKLYKESRKISHVVKDRIVADAKKQGTSANPKGLDYSYVFTFDEDSGTHSSTAIINGVLYPTAAAGTWISPVRALSGDLSRAYLVLNAEDINNVNVYVSADGGTNYSSISKDSEVLFSASAGSSLVVKVIFLADTARVQSLSLQYNVS